MTHVQVKRLSSSLSGRLLMLFVAVVIVGAVALSYLLVTSTGTLDYYKFPWTANIEFTTESGHLIPNPVDTEGKTLPADINDKSQRYAHTIVMTLLKYATGTATSEPLLWPIGLALLLVALYAWYAASIDRVWVLGLAFALGAACVVSDLLLLIVFTGLTDQALGFALLITALTLTQRALRTSQFNDRALLLLAAAVLFFVTMRLYYTAGLLFLEVFAIAFILVSVSYVRQLKSVLTLRSVVLLASAIVLVGAVTLSDPVMSKLQQLSGSTLTTSTSQVPGPGAMSESDKAEVKPILGSYFSESGPVAHYIGYSPVAKAVTIALPGIFLLLYLPGFIRRIWTLSWRDNWAYILPDACYVTAVVTVVGMLVIGWSRATELNILLAMAVPPWLAGKLVEQAETRRRARTIAFTVCTLVLLLWPVASLTITSSDPMTASRRTTAQDWAFAQWAAENLDRRTLVNMKLANLILMQNPRAPVDTIIAKPRGQLPQYDFLYSNDTSEIARGLKAHGFEAIVVTEENRTSVMQLINFEVAPIAIDPKMEGTWHTVYDDGRIQVLYLK